MLKVLRIGYHRGNLEIKQFMRQRESVVFTLLFPVLLLFIFGSVFKGKIAGDVTFSQYFLSGMIASALVNTGFQQLAIIDRKSTRLNSSHSQQSRMPSSA